MADLKAQSRSRWPALPGWLLRPLVGYVQGFLGALAAADLHVVGVTAATVLLAGIGLLAIHSAEVAAGDGSANTSKQLLFVVASLAVMVIVSSIDYRWLGRLAYPAFGITLVALALLLAAKELHVLRWLIPEVNGTYRWIRIGSFQVQPSEFAKISYILALSWYLQYRTNYRTLPGLLLPLALTLLPMLLILLEPDLGTVIMLLPVFFTMLFVAGARRRHLLSLALICVLAAPALFQVMHSYQRMRVLGPVLQSREARDWMCDHPRLLDALRISRSQVKRWIQDHGYQLERSKIALSLGGLLGAADPRTDCLRYDFVPERHNDFIFAVIGHKWGLVGCTAVIGCYIVILLAGCGISGATNEPFGKLLAVGTAMLIITQAFVNIGMAIGLLPVTGMTLPFVSYGGSSLLTNGATVGLLLSVGLRRPMMIAPEPFIFEKN